MREHATFSEALSSAMKDRGMSPSRLHERLTDHGNPMSVSALSYWRTGERKPEGAKSMSAIADIEDILQLEPMSLSALVAPSSRAGLPAPMVVPEGVGTLVDSVGELNSALHNETIENLRTLSVHLVVDVDDQGVIVRHRVRLRIQALRLPLTTFVIIEAINGPSPVAPVYRGLYGCRVVRTASTRSADGFGCMFALDRAVPAGQSTMFEYEVEFPDGYPREREFGFATGRRTGEIVLWARFAGEHPPDWIEESDTIDGVETRRRRHLDGGAVHAERTDFPPGALILQWGYARDDAAE